MLAAVVLGEDVPLPRSDRGRLLPGLRADVNVIDFDRLRLHKPELVHDMLACGSRHFIWALLTLMPLHDQNRSQGSQWGSSPASTGPARTLLAMPV
jgi:hypothetical protein